MKKYQLIVVTGDYEFRYTVFAENFSTTTNSGTSSGYYGFYADNKIVSCYPISKTIIVSIENADEE